MNWCVSSGGISKKNVQNNGLSDGILMILKWEGGIRRKDIKRKNKTSGKPKEPCLDTIITVYISYTDCVGLAMCRKRRMTGLSMLNNLKWKVEYQEMDQGIYGMRS